MHRTISWLPATATATTKVATTTKGASNISRSALNVFFMIFIFFFSNFCRPTYEQRAISVIFCKSFCCHSWPGLMLLQHQHWGRNLELHSAQLNWQLLLLRYVNMRNVPGDERVEWRTTYLPQIARKQVYLFTIPGRKIYIHPLIIHTCKDRNREKKNRISFVKLMN